MIYVMLACLEQTFHWIAQHLAHTLSCTLLLPFATHHPSTTCKQDRAFNDRRYYIGSSKLGSLGWQERTTWEDGLRKTIDWCVACWQGQQVAGLCTKLT